MKVPPKVHNWEITTTQHMNETKVTNLVLHLFRLKVQSYHSPKKWYVMPISHSLKDIIFLLLKDKHCA